MLSIADGNYPIEEWRAGVETRMLVSARNGADQLCLFEQWVAPGAGAPTHTHTVEEILIVLTGQAEMWVDDEHALLTAGQSLLIPAHRRHGFKNVGAELLRVHAVLAAPVFEAVMEGKAEVVRRWLPDSSS